MANATLRATFGNPDGSDAAGHLSAEIDTRPTGLNGGRNAFNPGETVYILVYKTDNVTITVTPPIPVPEFGTWTLLLALSGVLVGFFAIRARKGI